MPALEYTPAGRPSASPMTTSMAETWPSWPARSRARRATRSGMTAALLAKSTTFGRSSELRSISRNDAEPCWLTTRIISSGVTPLAASAATKEPAEVPT